MGESGARILAPQGRAGVGLTNSKETVKLAKVKKTLLHSMFKRMFTGTLHHPMCLVSPVEDVLVLGLGWMYVCVQQPLSTGRVFLSWTLQVCIHQ